LMVSSTASIVVSNAFVSSNVASLDIVVVIQQITDWTTGTPTVSYKKVDDTAHTVVGPLQYLDPSAVMNLVLTELTDQGTSLDTLNAAIVIIDATLDGIKLDTANLDVALSTRATEATSLLANALLTTIDADTSNLDVALSTVAKNATLLLTNGLLTTIDADTSNLDVALSTISKEATLLLTNALLTTIDAVLDTIKLDTADIVTATEAIETLLTGASRTPSVATATIDGSTTAGVKGLSMWVRGTGGTIGGQAVPNGAKLSWNAGDNDDTIGAIAYTVPTGGIGEIIITYLT